jgi:type IV pilus assembly protein PilB
MFIEKDKFKEFIIDSGLVTAEDFSAVEVEAEKKGVSVGKVLISQNKISEDDLRRVQAHIIGIPFVSLKGQRIDFEVLSMIPEPIARSHNIAAFRKTEDTLEVAMLDTDDLSAIDFVKKKTGLKIAPRLTDTESIKNVLLQYQKSLKAEFGDILQKEAASLRPIIDGSETGEQVSESDLKKMAEDLPVVRIVDTLLKHAILQNASDIHIEPLELKVLIRYRIDGILHDAMILPKNAADNITARIKVLSNLKLDEKRLPQDGRFKVELENEKVSFRVSLLPTYFGEKTVMRLLRENASGFSLEGLGFHGVNLERIHSATKQKTGMILTTGPTGSGKTTTLYTVLDIVNTPDVNISTIEDPIEYQMPRINQTQVKPDIGLTFSQGLRALMRQDPDIIMVGEIRDHETASLAINASLTGHLVLSTLHTNSAAGAIPRLIDMKAEPFLIVSTINVVIGQRLIRKLASGKEERHLTKDEIKSLKEVIDMDKVLGILKSENVVGADDTWETIKFYGPKPGKDSEDGYRGRLGIHEVLKVSQGVRDLIMSGATSEAIEDLAKKEGMITMIEDGIFKAVQGLTTIEEVFRVVSE